MIAPAGEDTMQKLLVLKVMKFKLNYIIFFLVFKLLLIEAVIQPNHDIKSFSESPLKNLSISHSDVFVNSNPKQKINKWFQNPFWEQPWFYLNILISVLIITVLHIRLLYKDNKLKKLNRILTGRIKALQKAYSNLSRTNEERINKAIEVRKIGEENLQNIHKMQYEILSNISHEFRTPVTLIQAYLEKIRTLSNPDEKNKMEKYYMGIEDNINGILFLTNRILDFYKIETNKVKLEISFGNLVQFIKKIYDAFMIRAENKQITFNFFSEFESLYTWFDAEKFEKIMNNLLSNAFKFTDENGQIKISILKIKDKETVEILVEDNGIGIPKSHLKHIFNRYYRDLDNNKQYEGNGLGLALCKEYAELHFGLILVTSELNKKTKFSFQMPIEKKFLELYEKLEEHDLDLAKSFEEFSKVRKSPESDLDVSFMDQIEINQNQPFEKPIILIADDNEEILDYIKEELEFEYYISLANNGEQAFQKAIDLMPDLIISDIKMPKMNGIELCNKIKNDHRINHIPILLLTAYDTKEIQLNGLVTGADGYIPKPFYIKQLKTQIHNLVNSRSKLREYFSRNVLVKNDEISDNQIDKKFVNKIISIIEKQISDPEFNVEALSQIMNMSRAQLFRKTKAIMNKTPKQIIRMLRLKRAAQFLEKTDLQVSEVMYKVGFINRSHFYKIFTQYFGCSPAKYPKAKSVNN